MWSACVESTMRLLPSRRRRQPMAGLVGPRVTLGGPRPRTVQVEIPPKQVVRAILLACAVALGLVVLWLAQEVLFLLLLAILLATAIERSGEAAQGQPGSSPDQLLQAGIAAAHTLFDIVMVFVLAFYWLVEREAVKRVLVRAVPPRHARSIKAVWVEVEEKLGGWVRGELLLMVAVGVMSGVGYWVLGLPNALLLAVLAGALEIVPMIGAILSSGPGGGV